MNSAAMTGWKNVSMILCCASRSVTHSNVLQTARVPTIRFRKGGTAASANIAGNVTPPPGSTAPPATGSPSNYAGAVSARAVPVLEDYQLPLKYRRRPIDEKEIEYINRGGPE